MHSVHPSFFILRHQKVVHLKFQESCLLQTA